MELYATDETSGDKTQIYSDDEFVAWIKSHRKNESSAKQSQIFIDQSDTGEWAELPQDSLFFSCSSFGLKDVRRLTISVFQTARKFILWKSFWGYLLH